ncbi:MAG: hypothetical protein ABMA13_01720 [Chthoniobacteraceae bacterium]
MKPRGSRFPDTRWTLIQRLRSDDSTTARRALDEICVQYYYPLYCYIRRRGLERPDAEDVLHSFLGRLLLAESLHGAQMAKGPLRGMLTTALDHFLSNWHRDGAARERLVQIDGQTAEERYASECATDADTPERVLERKWGQELMARVLSRLQAAYVGKGRGAVFEVLEPVLKAGGSLRGEEPARLAATLGMSEGTLRVALSRLLKDFRATLEAEVFETVSSWEEVPGEINHLMSVFSPR